MTNEQTKKLFDKLNELAMRQRRIETRLCLVMLKLGIEPGAKNSSHQEEP